MNKATKCAGLLALLFAGLAGCASHGMHDGGTMPTEPGQGAFGALAEVVTILNNDPDTDWSKVDIAGLRRHLVDMNALTLHAEVQTRETDDAIVFDVSGTGDTLRAIRAMVPAHAAQVAQTYGWSTATQESENGITLSVRPDNDQQRQMFRGLGFFGFMATGSHHQMHHMQMARGGGHAH